MIESFFPVVRTAGRAFLHRGRSPGPLFAMHCERTNCCTSIVALSRPDVIFLNPRAGISAKACVTEDEESSVVIFRGEEEKERAMLDRRPDTDLLGESGNVIPSSTSTELSSFLKLEPEEIIRAIVAGGIANKVVSSARSSAKRPPLASYKLTDFSPLSVGVRCLARSNHRGELIRRSFGPRKQNKLRRTKTIRFTKGEAESDERQAAFPLALTKHKRRAILSITSSARIPNAQGSKRWMARMNPFIKKRVAGQIRKLAHFSSGNRMRRSGRMMPRASLRRNRR